MGWTLAEHLYGRNANIPEGAPTTMQGILFGVDPTPAEQREAILESLGIEEYAAANRGQILVRHSADDDGFDFENK